MADQVAEHIAALKDEDWAIREEAAVILGGLKDPRAVSPLVSILKDSDRSVREAAIEALTSIGAPSVVPLGACLTDRELSVQEAASSVLGCDSQHLSCHHGVEDKEVKHELAGQAGCGPSA